jgi:hypothetical protein
MYLPFKIGDKYKYLYLSCTARNNIKIKGTKFIFSVYLKALLKTRKKWIKATIILWIEVHYKNETKYHYFACMYIYQTQDEFNNLYCLAEKFILLIIYIFQVSWTD